MDIKHTTKFLIINLTRMGIRTSRINSMGKTTQLKNISDTWILFYAFLLIMFSRI